MKKEYIAPFAVEVDITAENMIATSVPVKEETGDAGEAWSNDRRGDWGNLWN